jgi:DNA-binding beta-propeller fold protein YncE
LTNVVLEFDDGGNELLQFGSEGSGTGQFHSPAGIAVDGAARDVYVADSGDDRVEQFDPSGTYLAQLGTSGTGNGQFRGTEGVAVDQTTHHLYVVDFANCRIEVFG